tara:strand:- start:5262 stop:5585 length:324 start_codon:yes stop_codon:yes gene_type:complete
MLNLETHEVVNYDKKIVECKYCNQQIVKEMQIPKYWYELHDKLREKRLVSKFCEENGIRRTTWYTLVHRTGNSRSKGFNFAKISDNIWTETFLKYDKIVKENYFKYV